MPKRRYFLAVQTLLPDGYRNDRAFIGDMEMLRDLCFDGVELNIREPDRVDPADLKSFLGDFGLELSMFASGATAKSLGLSLASLDEAERRRSVEYAGRFLGFASEFGAGVIAGFLKGPLAHNSEEHRKRLAESVAELGPVAEKLRTPLLIEAINRFESPLGRSLDEAWALIEPCANDYLWILPDTWHMNIEESNMAASMFRHRDHFGSFHVSDNNRLFPGFGAIDFKSVIAVLDACGYEGKLAIEGNLSRGFREDVARSARYLDVCLG